MDIDAEQPATTLKQWSDRLHIPHSTLRSAVREGLLRGYQFVPNGGIYATGADMSKFMEESALRAVGAK